MSPSVCFVTPSLRAADRCGIFRMPAVETGRRHVATLLVFHPGDRITARATRPARLMFLGGAALEGPRYIWWNFVSSRRERIEQAKEDWKTGKFAPVPGETEFIPLPDS